jgi:hypothetical protein
LNFRKDLKVFIEKLSNILEDMYNELLENILNLTEKLEFMYHLSIDENKELIPVDYDIEDTNLLLKNYSRGSLYSADEYENNTGGLINAFNDAQLGFWKFLDEKTKLQMISDSKQKRLIDNKEMKHYKKIYDPYVCNNKVDSITLDEIQDKDFMKNGMIYIELPDQKIGTCYLKENLIKSMIRSTAFDYDTDKNIAIRSKKFYKLPDKLFWIDKAGFDKIPTNKMLKMKLVGEEYIGTYYGVSTLHGQELTKIYTFDKIDFPAYNKYEPETKKIKK